MPQFCITTEDLNTYGCWIKTEGIDLTRFSANPVMYVNHDSWELPVGRWEELTVDNGAIMATPNIDTSDEMGKRLKHKVDNGYLSACSIGVRVLETSSDPKDLKSGQTRPTITKCELMEVSLVGQPANPNATVCLYVNADGKDVPIQFNAKGESLELEQLLPLLPNKSISQKNNNPVTIMNPKMVTLFALLGVALSLQNPAPTEDEMDSAIEKLNKDKLNRASTLVDFAQAKGLSGDRDALLKLAMADEVAFVKWTSSLPAQSLSVANPTEAESSPPESITKAFLAASSTAKENDGRENWSEMDWFKNDPEGLEQMQLTQPHRYKKLVELTYGKLV